MRPERVVIVLLLAALWSTPPAARGANGEADVKRRSSAPPTTANASDPPPEERSLAAFVGDSNGSANSFCSWLLVNWRAARQQGLETHKVVVSEVLQGYPVHWRPQPPLTMQNAKARLGKPQQISEHSVPQMFTPDGRELRATFLWFGPVGLGFHREQFVAIGFRPPTDTKPR